MNIDNWTPFYKLDSEDHTRCMAQQTYEPLINPERTVFCANYDWANKYQRHEDPIRELYTPEVVDYFFEKELFYLERFKDKSYTPRILEVDYDKKRIFLEWHGETCNEIIYSGRKLENYCPTWREQLHDIMLDQYDEGIYKLTMYPHCYFIHWGKLHVIDWYGCVPVSDPFIEAKYMDGIIHRTALFRLQETGDLINGRYNLENMFKGSLGQHVKWGDESMAWIYESIFGVKPNV